MKVDLIYFDKDRDIAFLAVDSRLPPIKISGIRPSIGVRRWS